MTLLVAGFSGDSVVAIGQEVTQGTAVSPTVLLDATFEQPANVDFDPNRQPVSVNVGSINNTLGLVSRGGQYRASVTTVVLPANHGAFLTALGLTGASSVWTPSRPKPCTLYLKDGAADTQVYSGARLVTLIYRASTQQELRAEAQFWVAGVKPAATSGSQGTDLAALITGYVGGAPLGFPDLGAPTLPGGTTNAELEDLEITLDFGGTEFQGNGVEYPTHNGNEGLKVTGRFTPLHVPAEYVAMRDGTLGGGFVFSFTAGGHTVSFTMTKAKYTKGPTNIASRRFVTDAMEFAAYTNDVAQSQIAIGVS